MKNGERERKREKGRNCENSSCTILSLSRLPTYDFPSFPRGWEGGMRKSFRVRCLLLLLLLLRSPKGIKKFNCIPIRPRGRVETHSMQEGSLVKDCNFVYSSSRWLVGLFCIFLFCLQLPIAPNYPIERRGTAIILATYY